MVSQNSRIRLLTKVIFFFQIGFLIDYYFKKKNEITLKKIRVILTYPYMHFRQNIHYHRGANYPWKNKY